MNLMVNIWMKTREEQKYSDIKECCLELPDVAVRILGIVDLIALPFLAYSTVKKG